MKHPSTSVNEKEIVTSFQVQLKKLNDAKVAHTEYAKLALSLINSFRGGMTELRHSYDAKLLIKNVTEQYITKFADHFRKVKNNSSVTLEQLNNELSEFIRNFPGGEKCIIHAQNTKEYQALGKLIVEGFCLKGDIDSDRFTQCRKTGQCIEAHSLQLIGKLCIPLNTPYKPRIGNEIFLKNITENFMQKTAKFFELKLHPKLSGHLTFTLAALTNIDINQFRKKERDYGLLPTFTEYNRPVEGIVVNALNPILNNPQNWTAETLIRVIHSVILLSRNEEDFTTYLKPSNVQNLLLTIAKQFESTPLTKFLAQQLFQIRNIYPDNFPESLSVKMQPFLTAFSSTSHGSDLEEEIHQELIMSATELQEIYPIDPSKFNPHNPISEALGLESDITYHDEEDLIKVCIQVDGDRYHKYVGTNTVTQRTLLRDYCFKKDGWQVMNFTDSEKDLETAKRFLIEKIIIPLYEKKTANNIQVIESISSTLETYHETGHNIKNSLPLLEKRLQMLGEKLPTINSQLKSLSLKGVPVESLRAQYEKANEFYSSMLNNLEAAQSYDGNLMLVKEQLQRFDGKKAQQMSKFSQLLENVNSEIESHKSNLLSWKQSEEKLSEEVKQLETKISALNGQLEEEIAVPLLAAQLELKVKISNVKDLKKDKELLDQSISLSSKNNKNPVVYKGPGRAQLKELTQTASEEQTKVENTIQSLELRKSAISREMSNLQHKLNALQKRFPSKKEVEQVEQALEKATQYKMFLIESLKTAPLGSDIVKAVSKLEQGALAVSNESMKELSIYVDEMIHLEESLAAMLQPKAQPLNRNASVYLPSKQRTKTVPTSSFHSTTQMMPTSSPTVPYHAVPYVPYPVYNGGGYYPSYPYHGGYTTYPTSTYYGGDYTTYPTSSSFTPTKEGYTEDPRSKYRY